MMCHYPDLSRASDYSCHGYRNFASIAALSSPMCACDSYPQLVNENARHHNTFSKLFASNEVLLKISKLLENIKQFWKRLVNQNYQLHSSHYGRGPF